MKNLTLWSLKLRQPSSCYLLEKWCKHLSTLEGAAVAEPAVEVVCNDTSQKRVQKIMPDFVEAQ